MHRCVFVLLAACGGRGPTTIRSTQACDPTGHARVFAATTAAELKAALADVRPGDMIRVTGTLSGDFVVANAGTKEAPIALCGDGVLAGPSLEHGYTLHITADWWLISGLTVTGGAVTAHRRTPNSMSSRAKRSSRVSRELLPGCCPSRR